MRPPRKLIPGTLSLPVSPCTAFCVELCRLDSRGFLREARLSSSFITAMECRRAAQPMETQPVLLQRAQFKAVVSMSMWRQCGFQFACGRQETQMGVRTGSTRWGLMSRRSCILPQDTVVFGSLFFALLFPYVRGKLTFVDSLIPKPLAS